MDLLYSCLTKTYDSMIFTNNVIKMVFAVNQKHYRNILRLCRNCFAFSYSKEQHQVHDDECRNHVHATKKTPDNDENFFSFKNFTAR